MKFSVNPGLCGRRLSICTFAVSSVLGGAVLAQDPAYDANGIPSGGSIATNFPNNGDSDGRRKALNDMGINYGLNYVGEWQGNVAGGIRRGSIYMGRLEGILDVDLEKRLGLKGLSFHANGFQIHGKPLTGEYVGSLMATSYIEAKSTTRLSEFWLEQKFFGDKASLRLGQQAADAEFATSSYAVQFINGAFGWPLTLSANLPSGGPAYPFATPAARLKLDPTKDTSLLVALFNGDPAGPGPSTEDPQLRNRYGVNFCVNAPRFCLARCNCHSACNIDPLSRGIGVQNWV